MNNTSLPVRQLHTTSYPLCVQKLHSKLRSSHKLSYNGRVQYNLFLKEIGMSLKQSLQFWQREYSQVLKQNEVK